MLCLTILFAPRAGLAQNTQLIVAAGTQVVSNGTLVLQTTDLRADGIFLGNGTVQLAGAGNSVVAGSGSISVRALTLNTSPASTLSLHCPVAVSGPLDFQQGLIDLNGYNLNLGTTGTLVNESEASRITGLSGGTVSASTPSAAAPAQLNTGALGAILTSSADLGNLSISRSHQPASNPANGAMQGIDRVYLIQPANDAALNATLRFSYLDAELAGHDPSSLTLWRSEDGVTWTQVGADTRNASEKWVEKAGLADLSYWTLTDAGDPLPVTLISFRVACNDGYAQISWQTGVELNVDHFTVERSEDASHWKDIDEVTATNDPTGASYSFRDENPPATAFYRLKTVDRDSRVSYSPIFPGSCSDVTLPFLVFPNPAHDNAVVQVAVREDQSSVLEVLTMTGQLVYRQTRALSAGKNELVLSVAPWAAGQYVVRLRLADKILESQLIKQ